MASGNEAWMVFDCETDTFDGAPVEPFAWGWKTSAGEEGITWSTGEFLDVLKNFDGIALAHNGGKFDALFLAEHFNRHSEIKIINGRVAQVEIGKAKVRDSFLIIPSALGEAGHKDKFDYSILDRHKKHLRKKYRREINSYLMQDCRGLYDLVERFYARFGQRLTLAGAALAEWEKMGGLKRRWGGAHDEHFRQFYFGGRCEAFQKGALGHGWDYFDIKSSYPNAMQHEHPACHLSDYRVHQKIGGITPQSFARIVAASQGCLPVRGKYCTEYPRHDEPREYFATGWEILAGLETGTLKIFSATVWTPTKLETLKPYTDRFYAEKLDAEKRSDKVDRTIAKIMLNSLYGKFGAAARDYKKYMITPAGIVPDGWSLHAEIGALDILQKPAPGQFYDVALAASITGFARAYLFRQLAKCKDVAYSDTDSIICKGSREAFDIGENVGQWEHVCTMSDFHVAGKKLYAGKDEGGHWVCAHKGFSALDVSAEQIVRVARGEQFAITRSAPTIKLDGSQNFITRKMRAT